MSLGAQWTLAPAKEMVTKNMIMCPQVHLIELQRDGKIEMPSHGFTATTNSCLA